MIAKKTGKMVFALIAFAIYLGSASQAGALTNEPKAIIEEVFELVKKNEIAKDTKLQAQVSQYFDFSSMADSVLAEQGKSLNSKDRTWFKETLQSIITKTVYPKAPSFFKDVKLTYSPVETKGQKANLKMNVLKKGEETEVLYHLHQQTGQWMLTDVVIDDESWIENIRSEVQSILKKEKWAGLKKRLQDRLAKLNSKKK